MTHEQRIAQTTAEFTNACRRMFARLDRASDEAAERRPPDNGWTAAQVAWHVATTNNYFAGLIDGRFPGAEPAPSGFVEATWDEIGRRVPEKANAPVDVRPTDAVTRAAALDKLRRSVDRVVSAIGQLTAERGSGLVINNEFVGLISLYQVGEWATWHVIRHNRQIKRVLGE